MSEFGSLPNRRTIVNVPAKQYVIVDIASKTVKIQYKYYPTLSRWIVMQPCGVNNIFAPYKVYGNSETAGTDNPNGVFDGASLIHTFDQHMFGESEIAATGTIDGDDTGGVQPRGTGGFYGYYGLASGTATASMSNDLPFTVKVNGSTITSTYAGWCNEVDINYSYRVQGYNTKKIAGGGREIGYNSYYVKVVEGAFEVLCNFVTLEGLVVSDYYTMVSSNVTPFAGGTVNYLYGDSTTRKSLASDSNAGNKTSYPNVDRFTIKNNYDALTCWIDRAINYGSGYLIATGSTRCQTIGAKTQLELVNGATETLSAANGRQYHSGFKFLHTGFNGEANFRILRDGKMWYVNDFLSAGGLDTNVPAFDLFRQKSTNVEDYYKDATISAYTDFITYTRVTATGYGSYWYRLKA